MGNFTSSYAQVPIELRDILCQVYTVEGVVIWWTGAARQFEGRSARDLWQEGKREEVLAAAERLLTGSFS